MLFMTGAYAEGEMAKCGQIPVNKTALESDAVKGASFAPYLDAIKTAKARPTVAAWSEMDNALITEMTAVIAGEKTAKQAMDELAVTFDALLKK
jgi:multiple sugar transport system substrate-binding protein